MGITGGFGGHVAQALVRNGWQIKALMRNPEKLPEQFRSVEVIKGDAANRDDVNKASEGVDTIIYGVNPPNYNWTGIAEPLLENVALVAEEKKLTIVFPGNVYVFDPTDGTEFSENSPHHAVTSKGIIRIEMEKRLKQASKRGAKVLILRMGDFIGKDANSTWLKLLIKQGKESVTLTTTGSQSIKHSWANLPDVASTIVRLLEQNDELESFEELNFKGYQLSFDEIAEVIHRVSGKPVKLKKLPWIFFRIFSPFSVLFKGLVEMRYLWDREINLKDEKLNDVLGDDLPYTSFAEALLESGLLAK